MFSQTGTDVLPRRDEGSDKPSATIEPHRIIVPTRTRTGAARFKIRCSNHYTTAAHLHVWTTRWGPGKSVWPIQDSWNNWQQNLALTIITTIQTVFILFNIQTWKYNQCIILRMTSDRYKIKFLRIVLFRIKIKIVEIQDRLQSTSKHIKPGVKQIRSYPVNIIMK